MNEPTVLIQFDDARASYRPGESLSGSFYLAGDAPLKPLESVEFSIGWVTEGKGDEDTGVPHFASEDEAPDDPGRPRRFSVVLPRSPLSYDGQLVKIHWFVRARFFFGRRTSYAGEVPIRLGDVARPEAPDR